MKDLKGKLLVGTASLAMLGGIALGGIGAFALDTDVQVRFNADVTPPVIDPDELELRAVPAFVDFGTLNTGAGLTSTVTATGSGYVKVNDGRTAGQDWQVNAKAAELVSGSDVIDDATITITSTGDVKKWTPGPTPTHPGTVDAAASGAVIDRPVGGTVLVTDDTTTDYLANTDASLQEGYAIPISSVKIDIPNAPSSYAGKTFDGKITWTISDTL